MTKPLHVLLADDDKDDRFFFNLVLKDIPIPTCLTTVEDGVSLMNYLAANKRGLPDILFLDFNMPLKNGLECLSEIKSHSRFRQLPVIIYSTSLHADTADILYKKGALHYIRKTDMVELKTVLDYTLNLLIGKKSAKPGRKHFIISLEEIVAK